MTANKTESVNLSELKVGDTVIDNEGIKKTVNNGDVKSGFCGTTFQGGRYIKIERVLFHKFFKGKFIGFVAQP